MLVSFVSQRSILLKFAVQLRFMTTGSEPTPVNSQHNFIRRSCWVILLCMTPTAALLGQETQNAAAPNIEILKIHWEKQVRFPSNFDPSIIPTGNSFNDPASMTPVNTSNTETKTPNPQRSVLGNFFPSIPGRLPVYYLYSLRIKNTGKQIQGVAWDYLF